MFEHNRFFGGGSWQVLTTALVAITLTEVALTMLTMGGRLLGGHIAGWNTSHWDGQRANGSAWNQLWDSRVRNFALILGRPIFSGEAVHLVSARRRHLISRAGLKVVKAADLVGIASPSGGVVTGRDLSQHRR